MGLIEGVGCIVLYSHGGSGEIFLNTSDPHAPSENGHNRSPGRLSYIDSHLGIVHSLEVSLRPPPPAEKELLELLPLEDGILFVGTGARGWASRLSLTGETLLEVAKPPQTRKVMYIVHMELNLYLQSIV